MNEILKRIIDIESEAKDIMLEIEIMKREAPEVIARETKRIEDRIIKETDKNIQEFGEKEKKRCEHTIREQQAESEKRMNQLIDHFNKNRKKWEDEVYNRIISR